MSWTGSVTVHVEANERIQVSRSTYPSIDGERPLVHVNIGNAGRLCGAPRDVVETLSTALTLCQDQVDGETEVADAG